MTISTNDETMCDGQTSFSLNDEFNYLLVLIRNYFWGVFLCVPLFLFLELCLLALLSAILYGEKFLDFFDNDNNDDGDDDNHLKEIRMPSIGYTFVLSFSVGLCAALSVATVRCCRLLAWSTASSKWKAFIAAMFMYFFSCYGAGLAVILALLGENIFIVLDIGATSALMLAVVILYFISCASLNKDTVALLSAMKTYLLVSTTFLPFIYFCYYTFEAACSIDSVREKWICLCGNEGEDDATSSSDNNDIKYYENDDEGKLGFYALYVCCIILLMFAYALTTNLTALCVWYLDDIINSRKSCIWFQLSFLLVLVTTCGYILIPFWTLQSLEGTLVESWSLVLGYVSSAAFITMYTILCYALGNITVTNPAILAQIDCLDNPNVHVDIENAPKDDTNEKMTSK